MPQHPDELFCAMARGRIVQYVRRQYPGFAPGTVEDVVQDTFLRYLRYRQGHDIPNPIALLYKIAYWVAANEYRRQRETGNHVSLETGGPDGQPFDLPEPPPGLTNEHFAMMVFRIVEWLHERRPEDVPLFLLRLEHVPQKQMATQLGLTREAVAKRIQRMNEAILGHKDELGLDDLMDGLLSGGEAA